MFVCLCTQYRPNEATDYIQNFWVYGYWPNLDVISFWAKSLQPLKKIEKSHVIIGKPTVQAKLPIKFKFFMSMDTDLP